MANDPQIQGFDADAVRAGLRLAMTVGLPPVDGNRPVFFMPYDTITNDGPASQDGTPLLPTGVASKHRPPGIHDVACAIEYIDGAGKLENFGVIVASKVILTFLDQDYALVRGFEFVAIGGIRYFYRSTETPKGLVTVGLFRIHCVSEDEG